MPVKGEEPHGRIIMVAEDSTNLPLKLGQTWTVDLEKTERTYGIFGIIIHHKT
jgi:hypothetical protein